MSASRIQNEQEPPTLIDTSQMSAGQRAAVELTEAARSAPERPGFVSGLFMGRLQMSSIMPFPEQSTEDRDQGDAFLQRLEALLRRRVDPDEIDRTGEIPQEVIDELADMGAFGIKIPPVYGGQGLSQTNYSRAAVLLGGFCGNLTALLSAHQSIGVPQPLILFGTDEQKRKFLPRVAKGEISAFALTESGVGSDPANMQTRAEPTGDGRAFILNGEKLWGTERAWEIINDTMQIRGGRGYETADSLKARGEEPVAVERHLRDCRINTIFEGSSGIMRLFIAREALDPHLKIAAPALNSQLRWPQRLRALLKAGLFYLGWYARLALPLNDASAALRISTRSLRSKLAKRPHPADSLSANGTGRFHPHLARHLRHGARSSRKLARAVFHALVRYGPKLERRQLLLGRFVDIGAELFAIAASCSRAQSMLDRGADPGDLLPLVDYACHSARLRINRLFHDLHHNADEESRRIARDVLDGGYDWIREGALRQNR